MSKLPAFQFYPGDWRKDMGVQSLSFHDRGVWWEMLCLMHESERRGVLVLNGQPMGEDSLCRLLGLDKQILTTTLTTLLTSGVASREPETGAIICRRMVRDENIRQIRTVAGSKGGNPVLLNQKSTTGVKQIPTPSSSSSLKTSNTKHNAPVGCSDGETVPRVAKESFTLPQSIDKQTWADFEEHRRRLKKPMTDRAKRGIIESLSKIRGDPNVILAQSITRGWAGVFDIADGQSLFQNGKASKPLNDVPSDAGFERAAAERRSQELEGYAMWQQMSPGYKAQNPWKLATA